MPTIHGAITYLIADGKRVAKAGDIEIDGAMRIDTSNPVGTYGHQENFYTEVEPVRVSFTVERRISEGLVSRGLWPDISSDINVYNFKGIDLEVQDKLTGATLHRVKSFLPTNAPIGFVKGQKSMYRVSGQGLRSTEEDA